MKFLPTIRQLRTEILLPVLTFAFAAVPMLAVAQRVLLFEDFESASPDPPMPEVCAAGGGGRALAEACIGAKSVDTFNRSIVTETDATVTVTGGIFEDPFDPGNNQSLIMYNPDAAAQMAVNFASAFDDDPTQFRNGVIEFDVYLEAPQPESLRTFLGMRFGYGGEDRNQVVTSGNTQEGITVWTNFRLHEGGITGTGNEVDRFDDQGNGVLFLDPMPPDQEVIVPDRPMHVRYEINGDNDTWKVSIDNLDDPDDPVEIVWPDGTADQPWIEVFNFQTFEFEPAPGINLISLMSDASGFLRAQKSQSAYIDNLRIINNDLPPLPMGDGDYDNDGIVTAADYTVWQDTLGTAVVPGTGADGDGDGVIGQGDYDVWKMNVSSTGGAALAVPETPMVTLLWIAIVGLWLISKPRITA